VPIAVYTPTAHCIAPHALVAGEDIPATAVWIDLLNPTKEEERLVEASLAIEAPTREEMQEIEVSSRLYAENGAVYMTATVMSRMDSDLPLSGPVTFVLKGSQLLTIRYAEPRPFSNFTVRAQRTASGYVSGPLVLVGLIESLVNRMADVLEGVGNDIDALSREIFDADAKRARSRDFQDVLRRLGRKGDLATKVRESLVSLVRMIHFAQETIDLAHLPEGKELKNRIKAIDKDVVSLLDHTNYLSQKVNFLLDATLGLINIEQNGIIKLFSIVSVVLMPPTLVGTVYGMNFKAMPELNWEFGYPMALALMVISAVIPLVVFRRKGWM
jgi:magnesium transporter